MADSTTQTRGDKRSRILSAAHQTFAQKGYEKASVSEIVRRAGIAQGTFYLYFPAKSDLLPALSAEMKQTVMATMAERVQIDAPLPDLFSILIYAAFEAAEKYHDILEILAPATLLADSAENNVNSQNMMQPMLAMRQANGEIDAAVDLNVALSLLDSVMMRVAQDLLVTKVDIDRDHYIAQSVAFVCRALGIKL